MKSRAVIGLIIILATAGGTYWQLNKKVPCDTHPMHFCTKDFWHVYVEDTGGKEITLSDADPRTFILLNEEYGKDSKHAYWTIEGEEGPVSHLIESADAKTFEVINGGFAKDSHMVYLWGEPIADSVDPTSFVQLNETCGYLCAVIGEDKSHTYILDHHKFVTRMRKIL